MILITRGLDLTVFLAASGKVRGYAGDDLIDGVTVAGAPALLEVVKQGAATLSF